MAKPISFSGVTPRLVTEQSATRRRAESATTRVSKAANCFDAAGFMVQRELTTAALKRNRLLTRSTGRDAPPCLISALSKVNRRIAVNQNNDGGCSTKRLADSIWYVVWHFGQNRWNS